MSKPDRGGDRPWMPAALAAAFFLSGGAALLFETLWFRQAGLLLGNTVWSSSIVLASFMAGLAAGNAAVARAGARVTRPLVAYAVLELAIGVTGFALVLGLPALGGPLAPLLRFGSEHKALLAPLRLGTAFGLLLVPAAAMGATLPLLVSAWSRDARGFGSALGRLYGWNTLGALAGALTGELVLIEAVGVRATGACAAALNLLAAALAGTLARRAGALPTPSEPAPENADGAGAAENVPRLANLLAAAAAAGGIVLAGEVLWFRFLLLFVDGTSVIFAVMLAVVLAGIALGGLAGSAWLASRPTAARAAPQVALAAGTLLVLGYALFELLPGVRQGVFVVRASGVLPLAVLLMLPTCFLSGMLFTLLGQAVRVHVAGATRAAGWLTLANTLGAMAGSLAAGFVLLPLLGVEAGLFTLACAYGLVALVLLPPAEGHRRRAGLLAAAAAYTAVVALFPFGRMLRVYVPSAASRWMTADARLDTLREGLNETVVYLRHDRWEQPVAWRLMVNGMSMSGAGLVLERYMQIFAWWPEALHPRARSALLISYGVGVTAAALTEDSELESIDVVDVSPEVLALGCRVHPRERCPLADPRVRVHVEDGRFFLATTGRRYDVITGEPPPPKSAGIVNLYSKEYFQLLRSRLAPGGVATYWLPVRQLRLADGQAITRAFCDAFPDCSLWSGFSLELMLAGTNGLEPPGEEGFAALWRRPGTAAALAAAGLAQPAQLGSTFVADAEQLRAWVGDIPAVDDDHPYRLQPGYEPKIADGYRELLRPEALPGRFAESTWIRRVWPPSQRAATLARGRFDLAFHRVCGRMYGFAEASLPELHTLLQDPGGRAGALWLMDGSARVEAAAAAARARGVRDPLLDVAGATTALLDGHYLEAERLFRRAQPHQLSEALVQWRALALWLDGQPERARALMSEARDWLPLAGKRDWSYLERLLETQAREATAVRPARS